MPRSPSVWFRKQDQHYYTKVNGKQHKLSPDKAEARRLFHKLMAADKPPAASGVTVRRLLDTYLAKTAADRCERRTYALVLYFKRFCGAFGTRRAESLKPFEVNDWLDALGVSGSTQAFVLVALRAAFRWAAAQKYVGSDPLAAVARRKFAARKRLVTDAEFDAVQAALDPDCNAFRSDSRP